MRLTALLFLLLPATAVADDRPWTLPIGDAERRDQVAEVALDTLVDTRSGETLVPQALPSRLRSTRLLLLGESHTSDEFHRVQLMVLRELHEAGRRVVIGLEMMPREVQPVLDRWSAGELSEDEFLEAAGWYDHWGYPWEYYRPIFELARREGLAVYGLNVPRELVRAAREKGFDQLEPADRERLPPEIQPLTDEFRRLFLSYFDGDSGMHGLEGDMLEGFLRSQTAWDASMAYAASQVLAKAPYAEDPKTILAVLVGSGHVAYGLGIARQAAPRVDGDITTLIPVPVSVDGEPTGPVSAAYADLLWGVAEERWPRFPSLGLSTRSGEEGAREVLFVAEGGAAEAVGVEAGDVLLTIDGYGVDDAATVRRVMGGKQWGDTVELTWRRGDRELMATAPLRRRSTDPADAGEGDALDDGTGPGEHDEEGGHDDVRGEDGEPETTP